MHIVSKKPSESVTQRFGRLAKLPVFLDLANKRALVAGGSAAAAWKAELIVAAGAHLHIYASRISPEMQTFLEYHAVAEKITHHINDWTGIDLDGSAIVVADAGDEHEARLFSEAAKARNIICNVIDRPRYSTIQFGAIVNRSPVVVAISTDGAAPVLGQVIRRRIETLLPSALAEWATLAQTIREHVKSVLPSGLRRRRFWECFSDLAFGFASEGLRRQSAEVLLASHVHHAKDGSSTSGRVAIIEVNSSEADMLTLRALRAMQMADVILFDDLVPSQVLALTRREARHMLIRNSAETNGSRTVGNNDIAMKFAMSGKYIVILRSDRPATANIADVEFAEFERKGISVEIIRSVTQTTTKAPTQPVHAQTAATLV